MVFYFVQRGETLYAIARRYQTTVHAIVVANRLEDPNAITPGQALIIPRPGEVPSPPPGGIVHLVRPGETVFHLAAKFGTSPHDILRANQIAHPEFILPGQQLVIPEPMEAGEDWPMFGRTAGRESATPVMLLGVPAEGWTYAPRKRAGVRPSAPVIRYDRVYVGLGDGYFYSLDRNTGRVKWRLPAAGAEALGNLGQHALAAPVIFDGLAYLCGPDGAAQAVDAYTGRLIWRVVLGGVITSPPAVFDGVVYLGSSDEHVYALEAKTGVVAWKRHVEAPVVLPVAVGYGQIFAVTDGGKLWAVDDKTGEACWRIEAPGARAPVFAPPVLLVGERAYDPKDGQLLWQVDASGAQPVARLDQVIYPGGAVDLFAGTLRGVHIPDGFSLSPETEEPLSAQAVTAQPQDGAPPPVEITLVPPPDLPVRMHVLAGTVLLAVGEDQRLYAWDITDGHLLWALGLTAQCHQAPAVAQGQIVLALEHGGLQTFRVKTTVLEG